MGRSNVDKWADYDAWSQSEAAENAPCFVHVQGPDDVLPARDWREAVAIAHAVNADIVEYVERTEHPGEVRSWAKPYTAADWDWHSRAYGREIALSEPHDSGEEAEQ